MVACCACVRLVCLAVAHVRGCVRCWHRIHGVYPGATRFTGVIGVIGGPANGWTEPDPRSEPTSRRSRARDIRISPGSGPSGARYVRSSSNADTQDFPPPPPPAYLWLASFVGWHSTVPGLARGVRVKKNKQKNKQRNVVLGRRF